MDSELLHQISLTIIPHIGPVQAKLLLEQFGTASAIFAAKGSQLKKIEGIGEIRARSIKQFSNYKTAQEEIVFIDKFGITPLFLTDQSYPQRLLNCYDPPTLLYYKGNADLNYPKIISIIGTRHHTEYGKQLTEKLVEELAPYDVLIISGLAYGIDAIAHRASLKNNLSTVGVLAHGLDQLYPAEHGPIAKEMVKTGGGLLTEFRINSKPDKHNFPVRNRIVSGISDATVVIETSSKGGSMITAELANGYNRDVFAFPGRATDTRSSGCNSLIRNNKATLVTGAKELLETMGWDQQQKPAAQRQKKLFIEVDEDEKKLVSILSEKESVHIDELNQKSGFSRSAVAAMVLSLELRNVIVSLPGKLYQLT